MVASGDGHLRDFLSLAYGLVVSFKTDRVQCMCIFFKIFSVLFMHKINFGKKCGTSQECNNVTTHYYPTFVLLSVR